MVKEIYNSDPVSVPEVRELLIKRAKEGEELSYMQRIALEHAQLTSRISSDAAIQLIEELIEKFRISNKGAITLANFVPDTIDEVKQLLGKDAGSLETENIEEILNMLISVERLDDEEKEHQLAEIDEEEEIIEEEEKVIDEDQIPDDLRDV